MKTIALDASGRSALVDDVDFDYLIQWGWYGNSYARREASGGLTIMMHNVIAERAGLDISQLVDHRNLNTLDNQRGNLRPANRSQNAANAKIRSDNKSGYRGVFFYPSYGYWDARIRVRGKEYILGRFSDPVDAAIARDLAAVRFFGEFARTKFPVDDLPAESPKPMQASVNNKSGVKGVSWDGTRQLWTASLYRDYKRIALGRFKSREEAITARRNAIAGGVTREERL